MDKLYIAIPNNDIAKSVHIEDKSGWYRIAQMPMDIFSNLAVGGFTLTLRVDGSIINDKSDLCEEHIVKYIRGASALLSDESEEPLGILVSEGSRATPDYQLVQKIRITVASPSSLYIEIYLGGEGKNIDVDLYAIINNGSTDSLEHHWQLIDPIPTTEESSDDNFFLMLGKALNLPTYSKGTATFDDKGNVIRDTYFGGVLYDTDIKSISADALEKGTSLIDLTIEQNKELGTLFEGIKSAFVQTLCMTEKDFVDDAGTMEGLSRFQFAMPNMYDATGNMLSSNLTIAVRNDLGGNNWSSWLRLQAETESTLIPLSDFVAEVSSNVDTEGMEDSDLYILKQGNNIRGFTSFMAYVGGENDENIEITLNSAYSSKVMCMQHIKVSAISNNDIVKDLTGEFICFIDGNQLSVSSMGYAGQIFVCLDLNYLC